LALRLQRISKFFPLACYVLVGEQRVTGHGRRGGKFNCASHNTIKPFGGLSSWSFREDFWLLRISLLFRLPARASRHF
jgi:hypothetical protein